MSLSKQDVSAKYEEERLRTQEQSQLVYLQTQIDELRRQIKDTNSKYTWAMEQSRKSEAIIAQMQGLLERQTQEQLQIIESYRRELTALRKEMANSTLKIDDTAKPLRDIQLNLAQQSEHRKQDVLTAQSWFARIEIIEQRLQEFDARLRESTDHYRLLNGQLDGLRETDMQVAADIRKVSEEVQIEKQSIRRQAVEAQQMVTDVASSIGELHSRLERLDEMQKGFEAQVIMLPQQIDLISVQLPDIINELKRIERVSTERFLMNQERLEELRGQQNAQLDDIRIHDETHLRQLTAWLERIDSWTREHEAKLSRTQNRLEDVQITHMGRIQDFERRETQTLHDLMIALQQRLSQVQSEIIEKGGNV